MLLVASMWEKINAYWTSVGKVERKGDFDDISVDLIAVLCVLEVVGWFLCGSGKEEVADCGEYRNETSGSTNSRNFLTSCGTTSGALNRRLFRGLSGVCGFYLMLRK